MPEPSDPLTSHADLVERALQVSGLTEEELAGRLALKTSTLRRIRKGYQGARPGVLEVLQKLISSPPVPIADLENLSFDPARLRAFVNYLADNHDLLVQLKLYLQALESRGSKE